MPFADLGVWKTSIYVNFPRSREYLTSLSSGFAGCIFKTLQSLASYLGSLGYIDIRLATLAEDRAVMVRKAGNWCQCHLFPTQSPGIVSPVVFQFASDIHFFYPSVTLRAAISESHILLSVFVQQSVLFHVTTTDIPASPVQS